MRSSSHRSSPPRRLRSGEYTQWPGDVCVYLTRDEIAKVPFKVDDTGRHIIANYARSWPLKGVSRVGDVLVAVNNRLTTNPALFPRVLDWLNRWRPLPLYRLSFRLPGVVDQTADFHSPHVSLPGGVGGIVEGELKKLSRGVRLGRSVWHSGRYFVLDPAAGVLRRFNSVEASRSIPRGPSKDIRLTDILSVSEFDGGLGSSPTRFTLLLSGGEQRVLEAFCGEDCRLWAAAIATAATLNRPKELRGLQEITLGPVDFEGPQAVEEKEEEDMVPMSPPPLPPVRLSSPQRAPMSPASTSSFFASPPLPPPVRSPRRPPHSRSQSLAVVDGDVMESESKADMSKNPPDSDDSGDDSLPARPRDGSPFIKARRNSSPRTRRSRTPSAVPAPAVPPPRTTADPTPPPLPLPSSSPPIILAPAPAPAPLFSPPLPPPPSPPAPPAVDPLAQLEELLTKRLEAASKEYDILYEEVRVLVVGVKSKPGGKGASSEPPRLGLSLSNAPDGRVFVAAAIDPVRTSSSNSAGGKKALLEPRKGEIAEDPSLQACSTFAELREATRRLQVKALAAELSADEVKRESVLSGGSGAIPLPPPPPAALALGQMLVFDEAHLPEVTVEGLDVRTGKPVCAVVDGTGLKPGDVLLSMNGVLVKPSDGINSVAQRLLRRSMTGGTWVTAARPIGRMRKADAQAYTIIAGRLQATAPAPTSTQQKKKPARYVTLGEDAGPRTMGGKSVLPLPDAPPATQWQRVPAPPSLPSPAQTQPPALRSSPLPPPSPPSPPSSQPQSAPTSPLPSPSQPQASSFLSSPLSSVPSPTSPSRSQPAYLPPSPSASSRSSGSSRSEGLSLPPAAPVRSNPPPRHHLAVERIVAPSSPSSDSDASSPSPSPSPSPVRRVQPPIQAFSTTNKNSSKPGEAVARSALLEEFGLDLDLDLSDDEGYEDAPDSAHNSSAHMSKDSDED